MGEARPIRIGDGAWSGLSEPAWTNLACRRRTRLRVQFIRVEYAVREKKGNMSSIALDFFAMGSSLDVDPAEDIQALNVAARLALLRVLTTAVATVSDYAGYRHDLLAFTSRFPLPAYKIEDLNGYFADYTNALRTRGVEFDGGETLRYIRFPFGEGAIEFQVDELPGLAGSFWKHFKLKIKHVTGMAIVGAIVGAICTPIAETSIHEILSSQNNYVCTVNATIEGNRDDLISQAQGDLAMSAKYTLVERATVIRARQICLAAAKADPGRIDGVYGKDTRDAEKQFSAHYHIVMNWDSEVFRRFVVTQSMQGHRSDVIIALDDGRR